MSDRALGSLGIVVINSDLVNAPLFLWLGQDNDHDVFHEFHVTTRKEDYLWGIRITCLWKYYNFNITIITFIL